ncbi:MAG: intracellular sulfur oxidation DsrE/DsrF family protein [Halioglobus sp.]
MFKQSILWFALLLSITCLPAAIAQDAAVSSGRFVADIELQTAAEFRELLNRAEQLLLEGVIIPQDEPQVTFVLHGPVLVNLLRQNYRDNKNLVDLAASLSALDVIDVKACRTWMRMNDFEAEELQPFIETVAYGAAEVKKLIEEDGYVYF